MRHYRRLPWIALLAVFVLLFQQLAMAAYVCPQESVVPKVAAEADATAPCHEPEANDSARCQEHCHPSTAVHEQVPALSVPALPPSVIWLHADLPVGIADPCLLQLRARAQPPPLSIQHCTFQI